MIIKATIRKVLIPRDAVILTRPSAPYERNISDRRRIHPWAWPSEFAGGGGGYKFYNSLVHSFIKIQQIQTEKCLFTLLNPCLNMAAGGWHISRLKHWHCRYVHIYNVYRLHTAFGGRWQLLSPTRHSLTVQWRNTLTLLANWNIGIAPVVMTYCLDVVPVAVDVSWTHNQLFKSTVLSGHLRKRRVTDAAVTSDAPQSGNK